MGMGMKRFLLIIAAIICTSSIFAQKTKVTKPVTKQSNSFAIVIDNITYEKANAEVLAYRDALEADGLSTYIICGAWENPDQVKAQIKKVYAKAKNFEGVVFIGDVPYVMVRNAQHMTTAFKMDEKKFPIDESSVCSDRFYDDLHLEFEFLERDSTNSNKFWYKLTENSPQHLNPNFYSGRIFYPPMLGGDKYEAIAKYLRKAVEAKKNPELLDNMVTFAGHGYNGDCLLVWQDEKIAMNENFPFLANNHSSEKHLNFRMDKYMKYQLFGELERPGVDAFFFNEHGSIDKQHISGSSPETVSTTEDRLSAFRSTVNGELRWVPKDKKEEAKKKFLADYGLNENFFKARVDYKPEIEEAKNDPDPIIFSLDDIKKLKPAPRFVMFNACYNGSFHRPGYVAGYYIFGDGRTVVCQGNTVNVLQDRWTYEMVGLISHGVRIGEYNRMIASLEGHIIGDPTFHFREQEGSTLRRDAVAKANDAAYWEALLESPYADIQSLALRKLTDMGVLEPFDLLAHMKRCKFGTTRMECIKLLSRFRDDNYIEAIKTGIYDSYELTRRNAADYAWRSGDTRLSETIIEVFANYPESQRLNYNLQKCMTLFPEKSLREALDVVKKDFTDLDVDAAVKRVEDMIEFQQNFKREYTSTLFDNNATLRERIAASRWMRNHNYHDQIGRMLELIADKSQELELRVNVAEMLGWYNKSMFCQQISDGCKKILENKDIEEELRKELIQTINRVK